MPIANLQPIVGVTCCREPGEVHPSHRVSEKYLTCIQQSFGGMPLLVPALGDSLDIDALLDRLDGILVTGSPTNIEPHHYGAEPNETQSVRDIQRDATTLPMIRQAVARGIPVFAICRGIQELNVAFGGTLYQRYQDEVPTGFDHRSRKDVDFDLKYRLSHGISVTEGSMLHDILGTTEGMVNSLHGQAINQPGPELTVEARATDGCIEAISHKTAPGFVLGVQWHPEWPDLKDPISAKLFDAFGAACHQAVGGRVRASAAE